MFGKAAQTRNPPASYPTHVYISKLRRICVVFMDKTIVSTRAYKFRIYPSKKQEILILEHLKISVDVWNMLLAKTKEKYEKERLFIKKSDLQLLVKKCGLFSQTAQVLSHRLYHSIEWKILAKKHGLKRGFPRFKKTGQIKTLIYPQAGFHLGQRLHVSPFGEVQIVQHRKINGQIKTLSIKRESSGKMFAIFNVIVEHQNSKEKSGSAVGVDLGVEKFAVLSDGSVIQNPKHFKKWQNRLSYYCHVCSRKLKGGSNRLKARLKIAKIHEKIANTRTDFLHKISNKLVSTYSLLSLEKLDSQKMAGRWLGKWINDAGWIKFAQMLCYKAESAGCRVVFVDPRNTSKLCSSCGTIVEKDLRTRIHNCQSCGLSIDRDLNASINILKRATLGSSESYACGDGSKTVSSQKQESQFLTVGSTNR
jgi:putative transposase